ncbi:Hypothetical predicted protein [Mytilus galloprovincialis]|uniref:Uncharacterized protein n=1 Tax=Mytilus galloprovincialis TaxID=29158 RepID=A0A8B6GW09_MYTGA|nr:Hypothetical predicted protein [Mytilus galloprovincialis]
MQKETVFHTDVTALGNLTHKVVGYSHVTKNQERSSQKHETFGTEKLYEDFERKRIKVKVHSHDRNASVSKYLSQNQPDVIDSYDTWHGAKEVRRNMAKITKGTRKNIGKTWHPELRDKSAGVKTHVYWAMKNCNGNAAQLVLLLDSIVDHYKQDHRNCHQTSRCKNNDYVRVTRHYSGSNSRVVAKEQPASSVQHRVQHDHPRRQSGYRVLTPKQYTFTDELWNNFVNLLNHDRNDQIEPDDVENVQIDQNDTIGSEYEDSDDDE